jgi:hypothetical protein
VEFANAACLRSLSLRHWDQDDPYEMLGAHVFIPGGHLVQKCSLLLPALDISACLCLSVNLKSVSTVDAVCC